MQLTAAGLDYVVADMTNLPAYDQTSDAIQTRPFEVLLQVNTTTTIPASHTRPSAYTFAGVLDRGVIGQCDSVSSR